MEYHSRWRFAVMISEVKLVNWLQASFCELLVFTTEHSDTFSITCTLYNGFWPANVWLCWKSAFVILLLVVNFLDIVVSIFLWQKVVESLFIQLSTECKLSAKSWNTSIMGFVTVTLVNFVYCNLNSQKLCDETVLCVDWSTTKARFPDHV